jgi:hypothetical protein
MVELGHGAEVYQECEVREELEGVQGAGGHGLKRLERLVNIYRGVVLKFWKCRNHYFRYTRIFNCTI